MGWAQRIAAAFAMDDATWRRHANPWSVWTRFAAFPLLVLAIWSRVWLGWWAFVPVGVMMILLWYNPRALLGGTLIVFGKLWFVGLDGVAL